MKSVFIKKLTLGIFCGLGVYIAGCASSFDADSDGYHVRIPVEDSTGTFQLQTVTLTSVNDLSAMTGSVAVIRTHAAVSIVPSEDGKSAKGWYTSGTPAHAQFVKVGGVYYPSDYSSLAMASVMYHFEKMTAFYKRLGATDQLSFPRLVLFNAAESKIVGNQAIVQENNAAYFSGNDMTMIYPFKRNTDIPIAFNPWVQGHEFLHSIFLKKMAMAKERRGKSAVPYENTIPSQVYEWAAAQEPGEKYTSDFMNEADGDSAPSSPDEIEKSNVLMFQSINEGLADYFGYEYSGDPSGVMRSLPQLRDRDVSLPKALRKSAESQRRDFRVATLTPSKTDNGPHFAIDPHVVGEYFAHALYVSANNVGLGHERTEQLAIAFMDHYSEVLADSSRDHFFSIGEIIKLFFTGETLPRSLCGALETIFPMELRNESFRCASGQSN